MHAMGDNPYAGWPDDLTTYIKDPYFLSFRTKRLYMRVGVNVSAISNCFQQLRLQIDANDELYVAPCGIRNLGHFDRCMLPGLIFEVIDFIARVCMGIENDGETFCFSAQTSKSSTFLYVKGL